MSKQKDVSKVVTSAAYLLFYRRRSAVPLGGPRFQEIIERYDSQTQETSDAESGEGQRLGHGSSPRGSSSALQTGAGATLRSGKAGSGSVGAIATGDGASNDNSSAVMLPDYGAALRDDAAAEEGIPGLHSWQNPVAEEDEGIDMREWNADDDTDAARRGSGNNLSDAVRAGWNFANIPGAGLARSEADDGGTGLGDDDIVDDNDSITAQNDDGSSLADDMADEDEGGYPVGGGGGGMYPRAVFTGEDDMDAVLLRDDDDGGVGALEPGGDYVLPDEPRRAVFDLDVDIDADGPPPPYEELGGRPSSTMMSGVVVTTVTAEQIADEVGHAEHVDRVVGGDRVTEIRIESDEEADVTRAGLDATA